MFFGTPLYLFIREERSRRLMKLIFRVILLPFLSEEDKTNKLLSNWFNIGFLDSCEIEARFEKYKKAYLKHSTKNIKYSD